MSRDRRHIPDWELAMFRLGELPPERQQALQLRLESEPELAQRLAALDDREAELMARLPPRVLAADVAERAEATALPMARRPRAWWVAAPFLAALLALFMVPPSTDAPVPETTDHSIRDKGVDPFLRIYRQVPEGLEELGPDDSVGAGERLQISYAALGSTHGAVLSVDGRGAVTLHLPLEGPHAAELQPEGTVDLPVSYVLDDAPDYERFFLLTAARPFDLQPVIEAARALANEPTSAREATLSLPKGLDQSDFLIVKP